jgi:hypothetical protein
MQLVEEPTLRSGVIIQDRYGTHHKLTIVTGTVGRIKENCELKVAK